MQRDSTDYFAGDRFVRELTEQNFDDLRTANLRDGKGLVAILFYAPWCPYCKKIKDLWRNFAEKATFVDVFAMNCEKNSSHCGKIKNDQPGLIQGYPTIVFYNDGQPLEIFSEDRTLANLLQVATRLRTH